MSSFRPVFARAAAVFTGCLQLVGHRYFLYLACGRSVVVFAAKRRSVWFFQPICRAGEFPVALFTTKLLSRRLLTTIKFSALVTPFSGPLVSLLRRPVDYVAAAVLLQTLMLPYAVAPAVAAVLWIFPV